MFGHLILFLATLIVHGSSTFVHYYRYGVIPANLRYSLGLSSFRAVLAHLEAWIRLKTKQAGHYKQFAVAARLQRASNSHNLSSVGLNVCL